MPPRSTTKNKDNFKNCIVLLYKGKVNTKYRYDASEYVIFNSVCICVKKS